HAELPGVLCIEVREVMHVPARDEEDVAGSDTHLAAIEHPGRDAFKPVDRLIEGFVAVRHRHACTRGDEELEHRQASCGLRSFQPEPDLDRTDMNYVASSSG